MGWLRRLWCWWRGHDVIAGICLRCHHLRPISGGQFDATAFASDFVPSDPGGLEAFTPPTIPEAYTAAPGGPYNFAANVTAPPNTPPQPGFFSKLGTGLAKEFTDSPLSGFTKALGLGATGFGIGNQLKVGGQLNQATKSVQRGQKQAQAAAAPAVAFGQQTLQDAQGGKLPAPMQAAVEQWTQQAKGAIRARYASMGLGNSADITTEEKRIDLMAQSMIAELLQQQEQVALTGLQTGVQAATGGAALGQQQQALLTNLIAQANQQLGRLGASA